MVTQASDRVDITIAHRGHGDHHPVEGDGDAGVLCVRGLLLYEEGETAEDQPGNADHEDKETKLLVTVLESEGY